MVTACCQGSSPGQTLPGQLHANMPRLRASAAKYQGRNTWKQHLGRGRVSEASKLPLLTTAPSPVGKGQEDPPTFTKPDILLTAARPDLSPHCFHVHRSFSNSGAQQNLLGSLF